MAPAYEGRPPSGRSTVLVDSAPTRPISVHPRSGGGSSPAEAVGPLLRVNGPAGPDTYEDGVEVLVVEDQGVWVWGRDAKGRYVERENDSERPWRATGESTEEFWLHHAALDAVLHLPARRSAHEFDEAVLRRLRDETTPLPCRPWSWPGSGHSLFHRGASVVMICGDDDSLWVVASAPAEADLEWLDDLDLAWDESDSRVGET